MADEDFGVLDDGTEGANVGYRSYQEPVDEDDEPAQVEGELDDDDERLDDDLGDADHEEDDEEDKEEERPTGGQSELQKAVAKEKAKLERMYERKLRAARLPQETLDLVGAFNEDPVAVIKLLAKEHGVELEGEKPSSERRRATQEDFPTPKENESLQDYIQRAIGFGIAGMRDELKALVKEVVPKRDDAEGNDLEKRKAKARLASRVAYLDAVYDDWRKYQDKMGELLRADPRLGLDLDGLYIKAKTAATKKTTTRAEREKRASRQRKTGERASGKVRTKTPRGRMSLNEAWDAAKRDLTRRK